MIILLQVPHTRTNISFLALNLFYLHIYTVSQIREDADLSYINLCSVCDLDEVLVMNSVLFLVPAGDRNIIQILKTHWWKYLVMGLADVEANYTVVKAYQFTTLTSIQVKTKRC